MDGSALKRKIHLRLLLAQNRLGFRPPSGTANPSGNKFFRSTAVRPRTFSFTWLSLRVLFVLALMQGIALAPVAMASTARHEITIRRITLHHRFIITLLALVVILLAGSCRGPGQAGSLNLFDLETRQPISGTQATNTLKGSRIVLKGSIWTTGIFPGPFTAKFSSMPGTTKSPWWA